MTSADIIDAEWLIDGVRDLEADLTMKQFFCKELLKVVLDTVTVTLQSNMKACMHTLRSLFETFGKSGVYRSNLTIGMLKEAFSVSILQRILTKPDLYALHGRNGGVV